MGMSEKEVIDFLVKCGIWVKDGKIAKADLAKAKKALADKKVDAGFNPHGMNQDHGFGNKDLEKPIYHKEGRLIDYTTKGLGVSSPTVLLENLKDAIKKTEQAIKKGANSVQLAGDTFTYYDVTDQHEDYLKFEEEFRQKHGRNPHPTEVNFSFKAQAAPYEMDANQAKILKQIYGLLNQLGEEAKEHLVTNLYKIADVLDEDEDKFNEIDAKYENYIGMASSSKR